MSRRALLLLILAIVLAVAFALTSERSGLRRQRAHEVPETSAEAADTAGQTQQRPARPAVEPDIEWVEAARKILGSGAVESSCGPYLILTDADPAYWRPLCTATVPRTEETYTSRFGIEPAFPPRGMILLFSSREDFRTFVVARTNLSPGYAAFSRASRGIIAIAIIDSTDALAATLTHEIAHLAHRRTFGPDLPPWLSEGLADAISDTVTSKGIGPLIGVTGAEAAGRRLLAAIDADEQRPLEDLWSLRRGEFDQSVRSFDYEQSALLVRYLLQDIELATSFRRTLALLAEGTPYRPETIRSVLDVPATALESRFYSWLRREISTS